MGKSRDLGFHPNTSVELGFGAGKWNAFQLTDEEKAEIRSYAAERGFRIETARGMRYDEVEASAFWMTLEERTAADQYPGVGGSFREWPEPLTHVHWAGFGSLSEAHFVDSRSPGWEETAENMVAHNETAIGMTKDERGQSLADATKRAEKIDERARKAFGDAYREAAGARLKKGTDLIADKHISGLNIRVRELSRELEWAGETLIDKYGGKVLDWLRVASALVRLTLEDWVGSSADQQVFRIHAGFQSGRAPALMLNHGEYMLRHELGLPEAMVRAQLSGLAYLLFWREPYLVEATYLRDKLSTYENLLLNAIRDEPPLSEEAMARLGKDLARRELQRRAATVHPAFLELSRVIARERGENDIGDWKRVFEMTVQEAGKCPYKSYDVWYRRFKQEDYHKG